MQILDRISSVFRDKSFVRGSLFSIFSFLNKGLMFLLLMVLANYITPAEYGYLNLFSTLIMVLTYFIAMSAEGYWTVAYFSEGKEGQRKTFTSIVMISMIVSFLSVLAVICGGEWLEVKLNLPTTIMLCGIAICFATVYNNLLLDQNRLKERAGIYGLLSCGCALLNFGISIYLVKYCTLGWQGRVYAQLICTGILGFSGFFYFISRGYLTRNFLHYLKPLLFWSVPLIPHAASNFFRQGCDRYIINAYHSISDVGLFSFALTLATIVTMLGMGFNQSNSVDIYKVLGDHNIPNNMKIQLLNKQRKLYTFVYIAATILIVAGCYLVVPIVMPQYIGALKYVWLLSIYGFLTCIYFLWTNYLFFYKKTKNIMYVTFGSSVLHLLLSLVLTRYSLLLTALLYSVTQFFVVFLIRKMAKRELVEQLIDKKDSYENI